MPEAQNDTLNLYPDSSELDAIKVRELNSIEQLERTTDGPQLVDELVQNIQYRLGFDIGKAEGHSQGYKEGKADSEDAMNQRVFQRISESITNILYVKDIISHSARKFFTQENEDTVRDFRAQIPTKPNSLDLFVLIKIDDYQKQLQFGWMVARIQKYLLTQKSLYADIQIANETESLNYSNVKLDYPFSFR